MFPDLSQQRSIFKHRWSNSTSIFHKHSLPFPARPPLIHHFSATLNTDPVVTPPSLLPSAFIGQDILHFLPHEYLSGPFSAFPSPRTLPGWTLPGWRCPYLPQRKSVASLKRSLPTLSQSPPGYSPQCWQAIEKAKVIKNPYWKILQYQADFFRIKSKSLLWFISPFNRTVWHTRRPSMCEKMSQVQLWVNCLTVYNQNLARTYHHFSI